MDSAINPGSCHQPSIPMHHRLVVHNTNQLLTFLNYLHLDDVTPPHKQSNTATFSS
jgi:hypothetical protein